MIYRVCVVHTGPVLGAPFGKSGLLRIGFRSFCFFAKG